METVLFIAGGPWQLPYVKYLKDKGHIIYIVNPVKTETVDLCDYHIQCDIRDIPFIYEKVKNSKIKFVTSDQSDISTILVAKLAEMLRITVNNPVKVIEKFSNKWIMTQAAKKLGIPVPESVCVKKESDLVNLIKRVGFPIIIKPVDATNSRGFRKIENYSELKFLEESLRFSPLQTIIGQQYVEGDVMITLDGVCSGNKHKTLVSASKSDYFKPGITRWLRYPCSLPDPLLKTIVIDNDYFIEKCNLNFGLTHAEYIVNTKTNKHWFIECAARGAGAGIANHITPWVSGINFYDILYQSIIGQFVDVTQLAPLKRPAMLRYYSKEEALNDKTEEIKKISGVVEFLYDYTKKEFTADNFNCHHTLGIYLANDDNELDSIISKVKLLLS